MSARSPLPLAAARFVERPNRFVLRARLEDGATVEAHLADPGRLHELLLPGAALRLRPVPPGTPRSTRWTAALVRTGSGVWVSLETGRANAIAERLIEGGRLRGLGPIASLRREVRHGRSRFDFAADTAGGRHWIEVKSVTLVERGIARFPDAPTARGRRHVEELADLARRGERAWVLFVVQRDDAHSVSPHRRIDPAFAHALARARADGVALRAARIAHDARGDWRFVRMLPVRTR